MLTMFWDKVEKPVARLNLSMDKLAINVCFKLHHSSFYAKNSNIQWELVKELSNEKYVQESR